MKAILAECKGLLGIDGDLVVYDKDDMKHFQTTTHNSIVVCGRKTLESLPKKLKNRHTIVLTRDASYVHPFADNVCHSVDQVLEATNCDDCSTYVIGGAEIYELFAPYITEYIITHFGFCYLEGLRFKADSVITCVPNTVEIVMKKWDKEMLDKKNGKWHIARYTNNGGE